MCWISKDSELISQRYCSMFFSSMTCSRKAIKIWNQKSSLRSTWSQLFGESAWKISNPTPNISYEKQVVCFWSFRWTCVTMANRSSLDLEDESISNETNTIDWKKKEYSCYIDWKKTFSTNFSSKKSTPRTTSINK